MTTLVVLFNLKDGASQAAYEAWAKATDLPTAGGLPSVDRFELLKASGLLTGGPSPYQYVELLRVNSMEQLGKDVGAEAMQKVAAQFQAFADNPLFLMTETIGDFAK
jgi:REDY-like protein HapK